MEEISIDNPRGKRSPGRLRRRWNDYSKLNLKETCFSTRKRIDSDEDREL